MQPITTALHTGSLTARFDNGSLRYCRYGRHEVIRSLYFALRDQDWGTVPYRIEQFQQQATLTNFSIYFKAIHSVDSQDVFRWAVAIEGTSDNSITFSIDGEALQPFWRNRAGFCILHPIEECAGKPVIITRPDGTTVTAWFPDLISPDTPFPYIRAMQWEVEPGVMAQLWAEGDDFETEDQRNWGDTSYKTFCTPSAKPIPVELKPGDTIHQTIRLSLSGAIRQATNASDTGLTITLHDERTPLPRIGTQQTFGRTPLSDAAIAHLSALHLDHYRAELDLSNPNWQGLLREAYQQAQSIGAGLFVALTFTDAAAEQARSFVAEVRVSDIVINDLVLFQKNTYATPTTLLQTVLPILRASLPPELRIGAGTQTNFTELNRNRFSPSGLSFVCYNVQPQEHAFDDASLVENIEAQGDTVRSAQALYPNQAVYVSPLTLRKRFNPYAKDIADRFVEQPLSVQADARQTSSFAAVWLLGSLKTIAEAGAEAVTVFRAVGELGLLSVDGQPYSTHDLLRQIQTFRGGVVRRTSCSDKLLFSSLLLEKNNKRCLIIGNHTDEPQTVTIDGLSQPLSLAGHEIKVVNDLSELEES